MIYRNSVGDLIEINKNSYINDIEYMKYVLGVNNIILDNKQDISFKTCIDKKKTNELDTYIRTFLIENSIKNVNKENKNYK